MKPIVDGFSVVILGWWNPRIFSPKWIKENLCSNKDSEIELALPVNNPEALPRLSFEGIYLFSGRSKLEIKPNVVNDEGMLKCIDAARRILALLEHTPVSAVGINCGFVESENNDDIISNFLLQDSREIDSEKYQLVNTEIRRSYLTDEGFKLNLIISFDATTLTVTFNYHADVANSKEALEKMQENIFERDYKDSIAFVKQVYNLECEERCDGGE